jgi:hypothetical protein
MSKRAPNILDACRAPTLFAKAFADRPDMLPDSWRAWFVVLKALFAIPMDDAELAIFRHHTGRTTPPNEPSREAWLLIGRRGGKSFVLAVVAVFLACFYDYTKFLQIGERGRVLILAQDKEHAQIILGYVRGLLNGTPLLKKFIAREVSEAIDLNNRITIQVTAASIGAVVGYTTVCVLADEMARWPTDDAANADVEILSGLTPTMLTVPTSMLLCASSAFA